MIIKIYIKTFKIRLFNNNNFYYNIMLISNKTAPHSCFNSLSHSLDIKTQIKPNMEYCIFTADLTLLNTVWVTNFTT